MPPAVQYHAVDLEYQSPPLDSSDDSEERTYNWLLDRNTAEPATEIRCTKGNYIFTADGRRILDGSGGASVSCLGHNDKRLLEAVVNQMTTCAYVNAALFSTPIANDLCEYVARPAGFAKMFICGSGE